MFGKPLGMIIVTLVGLVIGRGPCLAEDVDAHRLIRDAIETFKSVEDYTCLLDKRVFKNGRRYEDLAIRVKYRRPSHYYFRWERGASKGREVIYAAGQNDDRIVAHPGGALSFITLHLDPEGRLAMQRNRHSLRHSGLEKIMALIECNYRRAIGKDLKTIARTADDHLDGKGVWVVQCLLPDDQGFYAGKIILFIDKSLHLPVKVSVFDGAGAMVEEYVFHELKTNVGFGDQDFSPQNPAYNYH